MFDIGKELQKAYDEGYVRGVEDFAERLKSRIRKDIDEQGMFPLPYTKKAYDTVMIFINNLAKEMTEKEGGMDEISIDKHSAEMV